jgi:hypothetical protein
MIGNEPAFNCKDMKQCPACQSQYTDDTLQFCLQDGSPLQYVAGSQSKTIAFGEQETVVTNRASSQINAPRETQPTNWAPGQFASNPAFAPPPKKSNATVAVILTAFVMLLFFGFVGLGAWLYFKGPTPDDSGNLMLAKKNPNPDAANRSTSTNPLKPTPMTTVIPNTSAANTNSASAPVDTEQIKKDVAQRIYSWKAAGEAHNLDSYMSNYGPTINYYNKGGASAATVRSDKQRAFAIYDTIQVTLSNMQVTPDASGERATAVFDKEWNFSGAGKSSAGKVKQEMELKKINGQWLISGEKDLKLYYKQ